MPAGFPAFRKTSRQMPRALPKFGNRQNITRVKCRSSANATANDGKHSNDDYEAEHKAENEARPIEYNARHHQENHGW